jgi:hypothetical protein
MRLIPGEPEAITYDSVAGIKADASAVIVGRIGSVSAGPDFQDQYGNTTHLATIMIDIEEVLKGPVVEADPGRLKLWTVAGVGTGEFPNEGGAERLASALPRERAVFFTVNMAELVEQLGGPADVPQADPEAYEVLGGNGFIREVDGAAEPPAWVSAGWPAEFRGRRFDEVVDEIKGS